MDQLAEAARVFAAAQVCSDENRKVDSKKRLQRILERKLKTSFIGALSKFEAVFGRLWGHGKDRADLTESEIRFRSLWELARTEVLNNGNNQIRAVQQELDLYTINFDGYQAILIPAEGEPG